MHGLIRTYKTCNEGRRVEHGESTGRGSERLHARTARTGRSPRQDLIEEALTLRDLRQAHHLAQERMAELLEVEQANVPH